MNTSKYELVIKDYRAIKEADITIEGITVLAGPNGAGKTTLARWFGYMVNSSNKYEYFCRNEAITEVESMLYEISRLSMALKLRDQITESMRKDCNAELRSVGPDAYKEKFMEIVNFIMHSITKENLSPQGDDFLKNHMKQRFNISGGEDTDGQEMFSKYIDEIEKNYDNILSEMHDKIDKRSFDKFKEIIRRHYPVGQFPNDISFCEDDNKLFDNGNLGVLLNLKEAVFLDTLEDELIDAEKEKYEISEKNEAIVSKIREIVNGDFTIEKEVFPISSMSRLFYTQNTKNGKLKIPLFEAAAGIAPMANTYKLLVSGKLTGESLLIIDEPELCLHPQWIVEYAKILIGINKDMGAKILISTHNPDMVAALQTIARKEGVLNTMRFYVATRCDDEMRYVYEDLGQEIGKIFDSFNIALSRIEEYGIESEDDE